MQVSVSKILKETAYDFTFAGTFTDIDEVTHEYTLFTNDQFRQFVKQFYGMRAYNDWDSESTLLELLGDFCNSFAAWKATRMNMYMGRLYALDQKFKPLENYNGYEHREGSFTHGEEVELSFEGRKDIQKDDSFVEKSFTNYKETEKDDSFVDHTFTNYKEKTTDDTFTTRSYSNYSESTQYGQQTKTHSESADDSSSYVPGYQDVDNQYTDSKGITGSYTDQNGGTNGVEKTTTGSYKDQNGFDEIGREKSITGTIKDQHGQTLNGLTNEKTGKETTAHTGTDEDEYTLVKYGNLGVTTSQQMLESDLDLIRRDLVMDGIREFIDRFTYFSLEVDDGY